jgi:hypothetical protein
MPFGIMIALCSTPLIGFQGLAQAYTIPYNMAVSGKNIGKQLIGIPDSQSIGNYLFFKPTIEINRIKKAGEKFINNAPVSPTKEINYEVLSNYFMLR